MSRFLRNYKNDALLVIAVNFVNNMWIKGEFIYHGAFTKKLDRGSLELLAEASDDTKLAKTSGKDWRVTDILGK
jgi:hypothetical protein